MKEFDCTGPITVDLRFGAGGAEIVAEDRRTATVEVTPFDGSPAAREAAAGTRVELAGDRLIVSTPEPSGWLWRRYGRIRITARVPLDSSLVSKSGSANLECRGRYALVRLGTGSGDARVEHVTGPLSVSTGSGNLRAERIDGSAEIRGASADVYLGHVGGGASVHIASGDIELGRVEGSTRLNTASGTIAVGEAGPGDIQVKSASGDVVVGVASGMGIWLDLHSFSGKTVSDLPVTETPGEPGAAPTLSLRVHTMSGGVRVHRAAAQRAGDAAA